MASKRLKMPLVYELSVSNKDKGLIEAEEVFRRIEFFKGQNFPLVISKAGMFRKKLEFIEGGCFVMGYDTFLRIFDLKYYESEEELEQFCQELIGLGVRISVGGRKGEEGFRVVEDGMSLVPECYREFVDGVEEYRVDLSSTEIRAGVVGVDGERLGAN
jgi:hypothetical protein